MSSNQNYLQNLIHIYHHSNLIIFELLKFIYFVNWPIAYFCFFINLIVAILDPNSLVK